MNQIIKAYEELANYVDILAEYINAIIVLLPQGIIQKIRYVER